METETGTQSCFHYLLGGWRGSKIVQIWVTSLMNARWLENPNMVSKRKEAPRPLGSHFSLFYLVHQMKIFMQLYTFLSSAFNVVNIVNYLNMEKDWFVIPLTYNICGNQVTVRYRCPCHSSPSIFYKTSL